MKPSKRIMLLTSCALAIFALAACGTNQKQPKEKQESSTVKKASSDKERYKGTYSNLNSKESVEEVRTLLSAYLDQESVDKFMGLVTDYDNIVGSVGLTGDFRKFKKTTTMSRRSVTCGPSRRAISSGPTAGSIVIPC